MDEQHRLAGANLENAYAQSRAVDLEVALLWGNPFEREIALFGIDVAADGVRGHRPCPCGTATGWGARRVLDVATTAEAILASRS